MLYYKCEKSVDLLDFIIAINLARQKVYSFFIF